MREGRLRRAPLRLLRANPRPAWLLRAASQSPVEIPSHGTEPGLGRRYHVCFSVARAMAVAWRSLIVRVPSSRFLAWGLGTNHDTCLTHAVFDAAVRRRRTHPGLIFHSDHGSRYASATFRIASLSSYSSEHDPWRHSQGRRFTWNRSFILLKPIYVHGTRFLTESELRTQLRCYLLVLQPSTLPLGLPATDRPLTMIDEPRRTLPSTKPREDPSPITTEVKILNEGQ